MWRRFVPRCMRAYECAYDEPVVVKDDLYYGNLAFECEKDTMVHVYVVMEPIGRIVQNIEQMPCLVDGPLVEELFADQQMHIRATGQVSMLSSLTVVRIVATADATDANAVALTLLADRDGYSRLEVLRRICIFAEQFANTLIPIVMCNASSPSEASDRGYFREYNLVELMQSAFPGYLKTAASVRPPYISLSALKVRVQTSPIFNTPLFWKQVIELNEHLRATATTHFLEKHILECEKHACPCYLGLFGKFEWLYMAEHAVQTGTMPLMPLMPQINVGSVGKGQGHSQRASLPPRLRQAVWEKHLPNKDKLTGECFVCESVISFRDMEAAHIVAHALGGPTHLDNLMPTCRTCNRDMGIMNLFEYKGIYGNLVRGVGVGAGAGATAMSP